MILSRPAVSFDIPEGGNIVLRYQSDMPESDLTSDRKSSKRLSTQYQTS